MSKTVKFGKKIQGILGVKRGKVFVWLKHVMHHKNALQNHLNFYIVYFFKLILQLINSNFWH
jgi:hypothetical protein